MRVTDKRKDYTHGHPGVTGSEFWAEREDQLRALVAEGLSAGQIGKAIGTTKNAAMGKIHRLGLQLKNPACGPKRLTVPQHKAAPVFAALPLPDPPKNEPAPATLPDGSRFTTLTITDRLCKWPIGDPGEEGFHLCGQPKGKRESPYCLFHAQRAYQRSSRA